MALTRTAISCILLALPGAAFAQQVEAPSGTIVTTREVGPRNALHAGGNAPSYVQVAPTEQVFSALEGIRRIEDVEAAGVTGSLGTSISTGLAPLDRLGLANGDRAFGTSTPLGGSGGGLVSSSIDSGMNAMRGALSNLPGRDK